RRDQEPIPCNIGEVAGEGNIVCSKCSLGYYSSILGGSECVRCPPGYECPTVDQAPVRCPIGTYSTGGQTICNQCQRGYYTTYLNSTYCYACPPGHSCLDPKLCPKPCSIGTYQSEPGYTSCNSCNGKCSTVNRLFECTSCIQAKAHNCTEGHTVPIYTCFMT
ncbi:unnamed protein product, partial [Rotaria sp. Silwood1]